MLVTFAAILRPNRNGCCEGAYRPVVEMLVELGKQGGKTSSGARIVRYPKPDPAISGGLDAD
jgi:hypothetical protein